MTNIKIVEHVVQELPSERPLVTGHKYKVQQENGDLLEYLVDSNGEPKFVRGITEDQQNRIEQLTQSLINKLSEDYSKQQIDNIVENLEQEIVDAVVQSSATYVPLNSDGSLPTPSTDNNFTILGDGDYGSIPADEGNMRIATWDGSVWSVASTVAIPIQEGTDVLESEEIPKGKAVLDYLNGLVVGNTSNLQTTLTAGTFNTTTGVLTTSINWIRTTPTNCEPSTSYIAEGFGQTNNDANNQRVAFYTSSDTFISYLPSPSVGSTFTFTTPANCAKLVFVVDSGLNVGADIPNSPYWDTFSLRKNIGEEPQLVAEKIRGNILTPQIQAIEYAKSFENLEFSKKFELTNQVVVEDYKTIAMSGSSGVNHLNFAATKENDISIISAKIESIASNGSIRLGFGDIDASFQFIKAKASTNVFDVYLMSRFGVVSIGSLSIGSHIVLNIGDTVLLYRSGLNVMAYINDTFIGSFNVVNQGALSGALKGVIGFRDNVQYWKATDIEYKKRKSPYMHISVDDTINMLREIYVNDVASIFDNPRMAFYKEMHDKYGAKFSFYCFFENSNGTFNLTMMPTKWKQEFINNSYWLKFGFHGIDPTVDYTTIDVPTGVENYNRIINEINRFAGYSSIDNMPRFSMFKGNTPLLVALKEYGLVGVLTADDSRTDDSGLSANEITAIRGGDDYYRYSDNLYFVRTSPRLDSVDAVGVRSLLDSENSSYNTKNVFEMFYHEGRESNTTGKLMIEEMCQWALEKGIRFDYPQNNIFF